VSTLS
jgi:hypothetical protein